MDAINQWSVRQNLMDAPPVSLRAATDGGEAIPTKDGLTKRLLRRPPQADSSQ